MAADSVTKVFKTVEILQSVARCLNSKDLLNFEELTKAAREAAQWERSNRDKRPKLIFLGHYGPLPHLARAHSVKLVIDERLNETHIPFITETIKEATYKSKKLVIEFPYKYPNPDDSVITLLNHLKHPMKLRIAERDLFRAKNSGLKLDSVNSLVITFNRSLYLKREIISNNPNEWNLEVIKTIVPLQNLQQLTVSSNATTQMFLAPKLRGFDNLTDLTIDEFDLPLRKINKESFPELKFLRLVDPKIRDYQAQADSPEELLFSGFIPCPVTTLTIKYYKASHAIHCYPDLKYIFPQLTEITVIGQYVPSGALLVIQNNLHIPKLRLLGCVLFGNLTVIITGTKTYAGVSGMTGLKYLELGVSSKMSEQSETLCKALSTLENLEEIHVHPSKIPGPLVKHLNRRFECLKIVPLPE